MEVCHYMALENHQTASFSFKGVGLAIAERVGVGVTITVEFVADTKEVLDL